MSKLICKCDLKHSTWNFEIENDNDYYTLYVCFRFIDETLNVKFANLTFGYSIEKNGIVIYNDSYPRLGHTYESSDQLDLETTNLSIIPGNSYTISLYSENNGIRIESAYNLITDIPPQPYPSWQWSGTGWSAPVNYPENSEGNIYYWNEINKTWDISAKLIDESGYEVL